VNTLLKVIFGLIGFLLPLHGGVTVFLPESFRWWKELFIAILLIIVIAHEAKKILKNQHWKKNIKKYFKSWTTPEILAKAFLVLGLIIWAVTPDKQTGIVALRYLMWPFVVFLIVNRLLLNRPLTKDTLPNYFHHFIHWFLFGCVLSIAFGVWVQFGDGITFVQNFYSNTISSWVPGQTLPLYHEVNGVIRMQGLSSGPIEFSHLLLGALAISPLLWFRKQAKILITLTLLFGIYHSLSRAALGGALIILVFPIAFDWFNSLKQRTKKTALCSLGIIGIALISMIFLFKNNLTDQRKSDKDHFTRPIEAIQMGIKSPFIGNLGQLGPAARAKNLTANNNDQAPIAENIFADYFAQLGVFGLIIVISFWISIFFKIPISMQGFFWAIIFTTNLATIFDMTPISMSFLILFAFLSHSDTTKQTA